jgi:hypothetical protein
MARFHKRIRKSDKYKYVALYKMDSGDEIWAADLRNASNKNNTVSYHKTEKAAAKAVDLKLIEYNKEPINVLVRA